MSTGPDRKPVVFLAGVNAPPLTSESRQQAGYLLGLLQEGVTLGLPISRPMPSVGSGVHELRLSDEAGDARIIYRIDEDAIVVVETFRKQTQQTPRAVINRCKQRLAAFDLL